LTVGNHSHTLLGMATNETPGQTLRRLRRKLGWTRADVAAAVGVTVSSVGHWESDRVTPALIAQKQLAVYLGLPVTVWASEPIAVGAK